jgi:molecular chaperone DnaJ
MSTTERDYYELLGVARGADEHEIKKAFRRLARQLHPDVSDEPDAEARFREVSEAYEVLSNPETRELYDRFGHAGLRSGGFTPTNFDFGNLSDLFATFFGEDVFGRRPSGGRAAGADLAAEVAIELADAAHGTTIDIPLRVAVACRTCTGTGVKPGTSVTTCRRCGGAGRLQQVSRSFIGEIVRTTACPDCRGTGRLVEHPCEDCGGEGRVLQERRLEVEVPAGIHDGQRIRVSGEGHVGSLGGRAGDVYVLVHVRSDDRFTRQGNDLFSHVDLTFTEASLGVKLAVETIDGPVEVDFDAGTQPGDLRVLRGKGMPVLHGFGRGDHRVLVNVLVPRRLTEAQRRLLEEFEQSSDDETYRRDEGFFAKLKQAFR